MPASDSINDSLTLRLGDHRLVLARYSPFTGERPVMEQYAPDDHSSLATELKACWASSPLIAAPYRHRVVLVAAPYTLVPLNDFHEEEVEAVFRLNFPQRGELMPQFSILSRVGAAAIWGIDGQALQFVRAQWPDAHLTPTSAWVIQHFMDRSRSSQCAKLFAYWHAGTLELVAVADDRLLLANRYQAAVIDDATYYVLWAHKQLGLKPESDEIYIVADERAAGEQLLGQVGGFVENVYPINPVGEFNRHPLTQLQGLPYDQLLFLLRNY